MMNMILCGPEKPVHLRNLNDFIISICCVIFSTSTHLTFRLNRRRGQMCASSPSQTQTQGVWGTQCTHSESDTPLDPQTD